MKKFIRYVLASSLALALALGAAPAYGMVNIQLDGQPLNLAAITQNDRTLVPARGIAEALGGQVRWDDTLRQVYITLHDTHILLTIDSITAVVNGGEVELDAPARIIGGSTLVPARFVAEALGVTVYFDTDTNTVLITTEPAPEPEPEPTPTPVPCFR